MSPARQDACDSATEQPAVPSPWTTCVHPEGWIYFFNPLLKVITDEDIRNTDAHQRILETSSRYPLSELDEGMEVQLYGNSGDVYNLAVNHIHCIASYTLSEVTHANFANLDVWNLNRRRRTYWTYLGNHPSHRPTPERAAPDAFEALTWFYTDNLISGARSIAPFSRVECEDLLRTLRDMTLPYNDGSVSKTVFLAWILREICTLASSIINALGSSLTGFLIGSFRAAESYGKHTVKQSNALREARKPHPPVTANEPSLFTLGVITFVMNVFFFTIPWTYLSHVKASSEYRGRLEGVRQNWERYVERLVREYSDFLLVSTVLLSATIGLLAVPDIQSASKVAGVISAFASLGNIIVGVFCIWTHQTNTKARDSFTYIYNAQHASFGLHGHAMLLSLPPVLLVWAILLFAVAIIAYTVQGISSTDAVDRSTAWVVLFIVILIFMVVGAGIYTLGIIWKFQSRHSWVLSIFGSWRSRKVTKEAA